MARPFSAVLLSNTIQCCLFAHCVPSNQVDRYCLKMSDEDVIKRRLLIDGDGTGDDRRLNVLQKLLIKWCTSTDSQEENQLSLDRMLAQLSHCEYTVKKSRRVAKMNAIELQNYQDLSKKIKQDIEEERKMIENTKTALIEAKIVRKNKMECDILGKIINEQPDRIETGKKLDQLKNELKSLKKCRTQIEKKMMQRQQQFYALVVTIQQLRDIVEEDDNITPSDTEIVKDEPMEEEESTLSVAT